MVLLETCSVECRQRLQADFLYVLGTCIVPASRCAGHTVLST